ncbi:hypothetical protein [Agrococcus sp. ProA11]|uniref:hypothetical protein n=1 Tax=Agrococcus chionoecetis TaxID=3153752 RepID=UPI00326155BB
MQPIDAAAGIGELMSWLCLVPGIPTLLAGLLLRASGGSWSPTRIAVVPLGDRARARWYAGGGFHERLLSRHERQRLDDADEQDAQVSDRHPSRMRLGGPSATQRLLLIFGGILTALGLLGFVVSLLPLLL